MWRGLGAMAWPLQSAQAFLKQPCTRSQWLGAMGPWPSFSVCPGNQKSAAMQLAGSCALSGSWCAWKGGRHGGCCSASPVTDPLLHAQASGCPWGRPESSAARTASLCPIRGQSHLPSWVRDVAKLWELSGLQDTGVWGCVSLLSPGSEWKLWAPSSLPAG